jgi:hypothetical protein
VIFVSSGDATAAMAYCEAIVAADSGFGYTATCPMSPSKCDAAPEVSSGQLFQKPAPIVSTAMSS